MSSEPNYLLPIAEKKRFQFAWDSSTWLYRLLGRPAAPFDREVGTAGEIEAVCAEHQKAGGRFEMRPAGWLSIVTLVRFAALLLALAPPLSAGEPAPAKKPTAQAAPTAEFVEGYILGSLEGQLHAGQKTAKIKAGYTPALLDRLRKAGLVPYVNGGVIEAWRPGALDEKPLEPARTKYSNPYWSYEERRLHEDAANERVMDEAISLEKEAEALERLRRAQERHRRAGGVD